MAEIEVSKHDDSLFGKFHVHISGLLVYVENQGNQDPECEVWAVANGEDPVQVTTESMIKFENCETLVIRLVEETDTLVVEVIT